MFHIAERGSALRGGTAQVAYEDIGGLKDEIQKVREMIELPLKYSTPEEAAKHSSEALVSMQHFEEAVKKIRIQREMKPGEKIMLPQYG
jgi:hypothetical protein